MKPFDPDDPWIMFIPFDRLWSKLLARATR